MCKVDLRDWLFVLDLLYRPCDVCARHGPCVGLAVLILLVVKTENKQVRIRDEVESFDLVPRVGVSRGEVCHSCAQRARHMPALRIINSVYVTQQVDNIRSATDSNCIDIMSQSTPRGRVWQR